jgi:hypothetical protein
MKPKFGDVFRWVGPRGNGAVVMFVRDWAPGDKWADTWVGVTLRRPDAPEYGPRLDGGFIPLDSSSGDSQWERVDAE